MRDLTYETALIALLLYTCYRGPLIGSAHHHTGQKEHLLPHTCAWRIAAFDCTAAALESAVEGCTCGKCRGLEVREAGSAATIRAAASCRDRNFWRMICNLTTIDTTETKQLTAKKTA